MFQGSLIVGISYGQNNVSITLKHVLPQSWISLGVQVAGSHAYVKDVDKARSMLLVNQGMRCDNGSVGFLVCRVGQTKGRSDQVVMLVQVWNTFQDCFSVFSTHGSLLLGLNKNGTVVSGFIVARRKDSDLTKVGSLTIPAKKNNWLRWFRSWSSTWRGTCRCDLNGWNRLWFGFGFDSWHLGGGSFVGTKLNARHVALGFVWSFKNIESCSSPLVCLRGWHRWLVKHAHVAPSFAQSMPFFGVLHIVFHTGPLRIPVGVSTPWASPCCASPVLHVLRGLGGCRRPDVSSNEDLNSDSRQFLDLIVPLAVADPNQPVSVSILLC